MLDRLFCIESTSFDPRLELTTWRTPKSIGPSKTANDGLAVVAISGTLLKGASRYDFRDSTCLGSIELELLRLASDESIDRVLVVVDSPGGSVAGLESAASAYATLAKAKPTFAYVSGMACSACYWLIAPSTKIWAARSSVIGSIGTVLCIADSSKFFEQVGVKIHKVSSTSLKGGSEPGVEITPEVLDDFQRIVDSINSLFIEAVQTGRRMSDSAVQAVSTGSVWLGQEAKALGLIDCVGELSDCLFALNERHGSKQPPRPPQSDDDHFPTRSKYTER